jgi:hypothetical protein
MRALCAIAEQSGGQAHCALNHLYRLSAGWRTIKIACGRYLVGALETHKRALFTRCRHCGIGRHSTDAFT